MCSISMTRLWRFTLCCLVAALQYSEATVVEVTPGGHSLHPLSRHENLAPEADPGAWDRGFVACVSGPGRESSVPDAVRTIAAIKSFRRAGNKDLLMVFHVNGELPEKEVQLLKEYKGVIVRDLKDYWDAEDLAAVNNNTKMFRSFDCKIMALLHSPFKKTMLIDSDTLFFEDPARVFDSQAVKDSGTLFFFDRRAHDRNPALIKGKNKCAAITNFVKWAAHVNTSANEKMETFMLADNNYSDFKLAHKAYCDDLTSHEQDASMIAVDSTHPSASKFLKMLKIFHTKHIMKNATVQHWGFGDKEFYWIACEFAGVHCSFSPRGRPMHIFFESTFDVGKRLLGAIMRRQDSWLRPSYDDTAKPGCSAQVSLNGDGKGLLYVNLSDKYCAWGSKVNAVTVWNPDQTDPTSEDKAGWILRTGAGTRPLTSVEQAITDAYRDDIARIVLDIIVSK